MGLEVSKRAPHSWSDGGWKSRKLWFGFYSTLLLAAVLVWAEGRMIGPLYGEFVAGVVGIVTIVLGGNVASKWVAGDAIKKTGGEVLAAAAPPAPEKPADPAPRGSAAED